MNTEKGVGIYICNKKRPKLLADIGHWFNSYNHSWVQIQTATRLSPYFGI